MIHSLRSSVTCLASQSDSLTLVALLGLFILTGSTFLGCSDAASSTGLVPVSGVVRVNGEPLPMGTVLFTPDPSAQPSTGLEARGIISEQGVYTLQTDGEAGARPGKYRVAIYASNATDSTQAPIPLVAEKYNNPETSGLKIEVTTAAASGSYDLQAKK